MTAREREDYYRAKEMQNVVSDGSRAIQNFYNSARGRNQVENGSSTEVDTGESTRTDSKWRRTLGKIKNVYEAPFLAITGVINTLSTNINRLFWGDQGSDGIFGRLEKKFKSCSVRLE